MSQPQEQHSSNDTLIGKVENISSRLMSLINFSKRILVIGEIILDKYIHGKFTGISQDCAIPKFSEEKVDYIIGGTGNIVKNLVTMGIQVDVVSVLGNDDKIAIDLIQHPNINLSGLIFLQNFSVKTITRFVSRHHIAFRADDERHSMLSDNNQSKVLEKIKTLFESNRYDMVVMSDYGQVLLTKDTVSYIVSRADKLAIPTLADPGKRGNYERFNGVQYIKCNKSELFMMCDEQHDIVAACKDSCSKLKSQFLIITLSEGGIAFYKGKSSEFQVFPLPDQSKVVDVCGAGDTVLAALAFGIIHGWTLSETCKFANYCALNVIQTFGTAVVSIEQVISQIMEATRDQDNGKG